MWYKKPSGLLHFCMLQLIKNRSRGRPGNKASLNPKISLYTNMHICLHRLKNKTKKHTNKQTNKQTTQHNTTQQLFTYMWYKKPSGLLHFCMLQLIKNRSRGRPGNKASLNPKISLYTNMHICLHRLKNKTKKHTNKQTNKATNKQHNTTQQLFTYVRYKV